MKNKRLPFAGIIHKKGHLLTNVLFLFIYTFDFTLPISPGVISESFRVTVEVPIP